MTERILKMPRLGETMDEGKVVGWLIEPGESFKRGDPILEIETDKTVAELPALGDGRLLDPLVSVGDVVEVGRPLARIDIGAGADWTAQDGGSAAASGHAGTSVAEPAEAAGGNAPAARAPASTGRRPRATPLARRLARGHGLDIAAIAGTGRRGRVEKADVLTAAGIAAAAAPTDIRYAALGRGRMAYLDTGGTTGTPILLLHGFAGDHTTWAAILPGLGRAGRRVIVPDLPGHGRTEIAAESAVDLAADLPAFLDHLAIGPVDVVGHSLGAFAALSLAAGSDRVGSVSLIAPAGLGAEIDTSFVLGMANARVPGDVAHFLRRLSVTGAGLSEAALAVLAKDLARGRLLSLANAIASPAGQRIDSIALIEKLSARIPVRVLFGTQDRIIPWKHVLDLPPRVAIHLLSRSGHMPQWEQGKDVVDILLS